jgi:hypothetical protein
MLIWREKGVILEGFMRSMTRLVCCTLVFTVPEFCYVVLAVGVRGHDVV